MALIAHFGDEGKLITKQELVQIRVKTVTLDRMVDIPSEKVVRCFVRELPGKPIVLWCGDEYDKVGQWTDVDVINRLKEVLD